MNSFFFSSLKVRLGPAFALFLLILEVPLWAGSQKPARGRVPSQEKLLFSRAVQEAPFLVSSQEEHFFEKDYQLFKTWRDTPGSLQQEGLFQERLQFCSHVEFFFQDPFCVLFFHLLATQKKKGKESFSQRGEEVKDYKKEFEHAILLLKEGKAFKKKRSADLQKVFSVLQRASFSESLKFFNRQAEEKLPFDAVDGFLETSLFSDSQKSLGSGDFLVAWALSLEKYLPDQSVQKKIEQLYEQATYFKGGTHIGYAAYRLSLMRINRGECRGVEPLLSQWDFLDNPGLRLRALYWRFYCAERDQNESLQAELRKAITDEFPLSLHALLSQTQEVHVSGNPFHLFELGSDPEVQLESTERPVLNSFFRLMEYLIVQKDFKAVSLLFRALFSELQNTEPEFQLYAFILMARSELYPLGFPLLSSCLRRNPTFISRALLEALYPKYEFDLVSQMHPSMDPYLILSIIRQESSFMPRVKSAAEAYGLMQLRLGTARLFEKWLTPEKLYDPKKNIHLGVQYFLKLLKNSEGSIEQALAAYNSGPGRAQEWRKRYPTVEPLLFLDLLPIQETREYVSSIFRNYYWYLKLYDSGQEEKVRLRFVKPTATQP